MMRALFRKALADLRSRMLQNLLIMLVLALATAVLILSVSLLRSNSMESTWDRIFAESNGAHAWFTGSSAEVDLTRIGGMDGVVGTVGPLPYVWGHFILLKGDKYDLGVYGMDSELPKVGRPLVTDGAWLASGGEDEIVLDRGFARALKLKVGDTVDILTTTGTQSFTLVGLAADPGQAPYTSVQPGLAYVLPAALARMEPDAQYWQWKLGVRLADPESAQEFLARVGSTFSAGAIAETRDWRQTREVWVRNVSNPSFNLWLVLFGVFMLTAAGFVIANVIGGIVVSQYREIGLLKAVGLKPGQVTQLFLLEYLGLGLAAGVAGLGLGMAITPYYLLKIADLLNTSPMPAFDPLWFSLILLAVEAAVALFVLLPARRGGRISTVQALTTGFSRVHHAPSRLARLASRLRLPPFITLGLKDAFARPLRAGLTVGALVLTTMILIMMLVGDNSIFSLTSSAISYDMTVQRGFLSDADTRGILDARPEIDAYFSEAVIETMTVRATSFKSLALGGDYARFFQVPEGRMFSGPDETVVTQGLLDTLELKIGDKLPLSVNGRPLDLRITGRYFQVTGSSSFTAMFALDALNQADIEASPAIYNLDLIPSADPKALETELLRLSNDRFRVTIIDINEIMGTDRIKGMTFAVDAVLLVIGAVSLFMTTLLGVRERRRDFGIFKTLGLTPNQVVAGIIVGVIPLALLAVTAAIPLGLWSTRVISDSLGRAVGMGAGIMVPPPWWWFALLYPISTLLAVFGAYIPARRAAAVKVVEVLRYE